MAAAASAALAPALAFDAYGYSAESVPFTETDISTTGTRFLAGHDDDFQPLALPFGFRFYGTEYWTVYASTNGLLSFGAGTGLFLNRPLTGAFSPDLAIAAVLWDDWRTNRSPLDAMYHQTLGEPGSRRFVVQWHLLQHFPASPSPVTFQAVLYEGSNEIEYRYPDADSGDANAFGAGATVGVRDVSGDLTGRVVQWSHDQPVIESRSAIRFRSNRPPDCSGTAASPAVLWPPDHGLREVSIGGVSDPDGDAVTVRVSAVEQDEPGDGGDVVIHEGSDFVRLRAERLGRGDGRTYTVSITATDHGGGECMGTATVSVPHDRR